MDNNYKNHLNTSKEYSVQTKKYNYVQFIQWWVLLILYLYYL